MSRGAEARGSSENTAGRAGSTACCQADVGTKLWDHNWSDADRPHQQHGQQGLHEPGGGEGGAGVDGVGAAACRVPARAVDLQTTEDVYGWRIFSQNASSCDLCFGRYVCTACG